MKRFALVFLTGLFFWPALATAQEQAAIFEAKGLSHFTRQEYRQALEFFEKFYRINPKNEQNLYRLGITHLKLNNDRQTAQFFKKLLDYFPASELAPEAKEWVARLEKEKRLSLKGSVSTYYDSNVTRDPDNQTLAGFSDRDDWMSAGTLDFDYHLADSGKTRFSAGYDGYQSAYWNILNIDANRFNYSSHLARLTLSRQFSDNIQWTIPAGYNFVLLGKAKYLQSASMESLLDILHGKNWMLSVTGGIRRDWFFQNLSNAAQNRDAIQPYARIEEYFFVPKNREVYFKAGYGFDRNFAGGNDWDFSAHHALYAIHFPLWRQIKVLLAGDVVVWRSFKNTDSVFNARRRDRSLYHTAVLSRDILPWLEAAASYSLFIRDSTLGRYQYRRHVAGLTFTAKL